MAHNGRKVFLALSGGVDSAVAALLLGEQGYDVRGYFLKIWSDTKDANGQCTWVTDRRDALAVGAKLGIPVTTLDFEQEYKDRVFSTFVAEYEAGRTPNPDVLCNEVIKFGAFLDYALAHGADAIATGHYARIVQRGERFALLSGVDSNKDQSYFLSTLQQAQLAKTLFPIGELTKPAVRQIAARFGLPVADKRSTRGICFIGKVDLQSFLQRYTESKPGPVVNSAGLLLGQHQGAHAYTIGQRQGLAVSPQSPESEPYYVVDKDTDKNTVVVAQGKQAGALFDKQLLASHLHWVSGIAPVMPKRFSVRIRHRQPLQSADIEFLNEQTLVVRFDEAQRAIASGQVVVFYDGDELIGSGIIK